MKLFFGAAVLLFGLFSVPALAQSERTSIANLRCEYLTNPLSIDTVTPRLSWIIASPARSWRQKSYRIQVASTPALLQAGKPDKWDSRQVDSSQTANVRYAGAPPKSGARLYWRVEVWGVDGRTISPIQFWQMGLLNAADWKARWVAAPFARDTQAEGIKLPSPPYFRKTFALVKPIKHATLYATAHGVYELRLNGAKVGDELLAPGWTDYNVRTQYQAYDVTAQLKRGANAISAIVGDGWFSGFVGMGGHRDYYGDRPALLAQLDVEYLDGTHQLISTDLSWQTKIGPIVYSDLLMGERYDARKTEANWDTPGFDAKTWQSAILDSPAAKPGLSLLVGTHGPAIRVTQELKPVKISQLLPGNFIFDMGQNMAGVVRLKVRGAAGTQVRLRFAEMLKLDGTAYTANLRGARATDTYICRGDGEEVWEPRFTYHGFRYVEVTGYPGEPAPDAITGLVIGSDTPKTGSFQCSSPLVNQLQSNIDWGQRGNFLSVPTDCPQRDERLGWMGDAQIFARTAAYNRDVSAFFTKWLQDVEDAQASDGGFSAVSPRLVNPKNGAPAWGDAGVIVPWTMYQAYGDTEIINRHWNAMTRWMNYITEANPDGLWTARRAANYSDWLSINADTPKDVLSTAYYAYDAALMANMARAIGRSAEAAKYDALFERIKRAFNTAFVQSDGTIQGDTQTCYLLALHFNLLPENLRPLAADRLAQNIAAKNNHLSTGFVGVGYLCPTLSETGHNDLAYQLLLNETFPSWGYSIKRGATTIWERWDGWTEEKGFQNAGMNSFNHYSLGSVGEWLYKDVAGIATDPNYPGFERIILHPQPGPGLTYVNASYDSIRGRIISNWKIEANHFTLDVTIPANTTATLYLPASGAAQIQESGQPVALVKGIRFIRQEQGSVVLEVGLGSYQFSSTL